MKKFWVALVLAVTCFVGVGVATGAPARYLQGSTILDGFVVKTAPDIEVTSATTNAVITAETINGSVTAAGVGADGLGASIDFELETETASTVDPAGKIAVLWTDATANSTDSDMVFSIRAADSTLAAMKLASPGVLQVYSAGTVPTFSVATLAGELGVEGDIECDANVDIAGTLTVGGAMTFASAETINIDNATNNASMTGITLNRSVTSTAAGADSLATAISIGLETETNATVDEAGLLTWTWLDATASSTDSKLDVGVRIADTTTSILTVTSPGVVQVHDGSVPSFSVATSAGSP
ncbi:MAG: hypothetical protein WC642_15920, partial [Nocardioides sp.]